MGVNQNDNKEKKNANKALNENIIIGYIEIKESNQKYRIINSYENVKREEPKKSILNIYNKSKKNEKEIKNCEIFINENKIKFDNFYNFETEGKYIIKYVFKNLINLTNYMFYDCNKIESLDLSNFNTKNVTKLEYMFHN